MKSKEVRVGDNEFYPGEVREGVKWKVICERSLKNEYLPGREERAVTLVAVVGTACAKAQVCKSVSPEGTRHRSERPVVEDGGGEVGRNRPWQAPDGLPGDLGSTPSVWRSREMFRKGGY